MKYKIGLFPMAADLLHIGHIKALEYAKEHCDKLIVCLNCNPTKENTNKQIPIESIYERYTKLKSVSFVDDVIPYDGENDLELLLRTTKYDVRFIGYDHLESDWTGSKFEKENYIDYIAIPRKHTISSTQLKQRILNYYGGKNANNCK